MNLCGWLGCLTLGHLVACKAVDVGHDASVMRSPASQQASMALEGAELKETVAGQTVWQLKAARIDYHGAAGRAELTDIQAQFFENGRLVSACRAPRATFYPGDRRLLLTGGIRMESRVIDAGFEAREATWSPALGRLSVRGKVRFWRGASTLVASRLDADRALQRIELGEVQGHLVLRPWAPGG